MNFAERRFKKHAVNACTYVHLQKTKILWSKLFDERHSKPPASPVRESTYKNHRRAFQIAAEWAVMVG